MLKKLLLGLLSLALLFTLASCNPFKSDEADDMESKEKQSGSVSDVTTDPTDPTDSTDNQNKPEAPSNSGSLNTEENGDGVEVDYEDFQPWEG